MKLILRRIFVIRLKQRNSRCKVVAQSNKDSFSRERSLLFVEDYNGGAPFFQKHARSVQFRQFRKCSMHHTSILSESVRIVIFCFSIVNTINVSTSKTLFFSCSQDHISTLHPGSVVSLAVFGSQPLYIINNQYTLRARLTVVAQKQKHKLYTGRGH